MPKIKYMGLQIKPVILKSTYQNIKKCKYTYFTSMSNNKVTEGFVFCWVGGAVLFSFIIQVQIINSQTARTVIYSSLHHHSTVQPGSGLKADPLNPGRCLPGFQADWPSHYPQPRSYRPDFPWAFPVPRTGPGRQELLVQSLQTGMCRHETDPNGSKGIHFQNFCFQRFSFLSSTW